MGGMWPLDPPWNYIPEYPGNPQIFRIRDPLNIQTMIPRPFQGFVAEPGLPPTKAVTVFPPNIHLFPGTPHSLWICAGDVEQARNRRRESKPSWERAPSSCAPVSRNSSEELGKSRMKTFEDLFQPVPKPRS